MSSSRKPKGKQQEEWNLKKISLQKDEFENVLSLMEHGKGEKVANINIQDEFENVVSLMDYGKEEKVANMNNDGSGYGKSYNSNMYV